jgi:hypothetical protein
VRRGAERAGVSQRSRHAVPVDAKLHYRVPQDDKGLLGSTLRSASWRRSTGSTGLISAGCSSRLATCRRRSTRRATMSRLETSVRFPWMAGAFALVVGELRRCQSRLPSGCEFDGLEVSPRSQSTAHRQCDAGVGEAIGIANDVVLTGGATPAAIVAFCFATAFGAVAIFSFVHLRRRGVQWGDRSNAPITRSRTSDAPRDALGRGKTTA